MLGVAQASCLRFPANMWYKPTMTDPSHSGAPLLTLDRLRRIQATLERRVAGRDPANIRQVGFAPQAAERGRSERSASQLTTHPSSASLPVTAQFDVKRKRQRPPAGERIESVESVRLLERASRTYLTLELDTDVLETGDILPTGVRVENGGDYATTSAVVRWTKVEPAPSIGNLEDAQDFRWRWGVLTVAHLFSNLLGARGGARVERLATCGAGPETVRGQMIARGRVPGGPDISLIETGLDRLWLSGLLPRPHGPPLATASQQQLLHWIAMGSEGVYIGDGVAHHWRWQTFYPELSIPQLGRLRHIVRYQSTGVQTKAIPFGPGSSGGVLVAGGIPIGIQIAATGPLFQEAYAQCFDVSLAWLKRRLRATALELVHLPLGTS